MGTGGKYVDICDEVREQASAEGAIVVIYRGAKGNGFSIVGSPEFCQAVPSVLRQMADQIEGDNRAIRGALS